MISFWWFVFFAVTIYSTAYRHGEVNALYKANRSRRWNFNRREYNENERRD